jgi:hypothetical protein
LREKPRWVKLRYLAKRVKEREFYLRAQGASEDAIFRAQRRTWRWLEHASRAFDEARLGMIHVEEKREDARKARAERMRKK